MGQREKRRWLVSGSPELTVSKRVRIVNRFHVKMSPPSWRISSLHTDAAGSAPDAFGPFRILHQIGAGTLGPVFRAFDPDSDRLVAVKVFTTDLPPERVHQVVAEFERLLGASLRHRAIAAPIAAGIHDNHPYLVQEYVSADSLDIVVRHGPASPGDAVRVAAQLAAALDFAAADDVEHGALHPRDVLLTSDETRLTGLGIVRAFERVDVPAPIRRPYTAPECIVAKPWDRRADVFSLAAVMHELMWGRRLSAVGEQASESLTPIEGADLDALRALFARALADDPADRFENAMEFADGLKQAFPKVVLLSSRKRTPRAAASPGSVERREIEPRLPLDEPEQEEEALWRMSPTPVEVDVRRMEDLPIRRDEPEPDLVVETPSASPVVPGFGATGFGEIEVEPEAMSEAPVRMAVPAGLLDALPDPIHGVAQPRRSEIWPLALALVVGAAIGFGGGYFFANIERTSEPAVASAAQTSPSSRDFTENTIDNAPVPATDLASASPAPAVPAAAAPRAAATPPRAPAKPEAANAAAPPSLGRLLVRSTPSGARVFVDGREEGTTPLTVTDLERGVHRVRVVREGYATAERRITMTAGRSSQTMTVPLARVKTAQAAATSATTAAATEPGGITVVSRPAGANVFVDDKLVGTTPLQVPGLAAGAYRVRLELAGYRVWASSVNVAAAEQKRVSASLDR